MTIYSTYGYRG